MGAARLREGLAKGGGLIGEPLSGVVCWGWSVWARRLAASEGNPAGCRGEVALFLDP